MPQLTIQQALDLARQHHDSGRLGQAEQMYRQILAYKPNHVDALQGLGMLAAQVGRKDAAVDLVGRAVALRPHDAHLHSNLGNALTGVGRREEAIAAYRQAIALKEDFAEAHYNLGIALLDKGEVDQAVAACRRAVALKPSFTEVYIILGNACKEQGQLDQALDWFRQAMALKPQDAMAHGNLCLAMYYHPGYDARSILAELRRWAQCHERPLAAEIRPGNNDPSPDRRLKVGYVSADFRDHPVGRFCLPLLAHHDHQRFEVFCYSDGYWTDATTQRLEGYCDHWHSVVGLPDAQLAKRIRADGIDVLVDLAAHTAGNRLLVFARKPAPVQVTYLAYCGTTGMASIDYRLSDPYLDPPGRDDSVYSEQTIRLPETYWCYEPGNLTPEVSSLPALEHGAITFGCLNNFCKISEPTLAAWVELLRAVPQSRLLVHAHQGSHRQRLHERLGREGIEPARVQFAGRMPIEKYFELYRQIDLALDTFPYAGGTTTCDALWMGVPVVSLVGQTAVGRGGLSILSNVGLAELAARSEQEYVRLARDLAHDLSRLSHLRSTLRQRMQRSPLLDASRFAGHIEAAYRQIWQTWCQKNPAST